MKPNDLKYYTVEQVDAILDDRRNLHLHQEDKFTELRRKHDKLVAMIERNRRRVLLFTMSWSAELGPNDYVNS